MRGFRIACSLPILLATAGGPFLPLETFGAEAVRTSTVAESMPVLLPHGSEIQALRRQIDQVEALARKLRDRHGRPVMHESERAGGGKGLDRVAEDLTQVRVALNRLVVDLGGVDRELDEAEASRRREMEMWVLRRLKEVRIPAFELPPSATLFDAVDFFRTVAKEAGEKDGTHGVSFIVNLAEGCEKAPVIPSVRANNISLHEALELVCRLTGYRFEVDGGLVVLTPKSPCGCRR